MFLSVGEFLLKQNCIWLSLTWLGVESKASILGLLLAANLSLFRMAPVVTSMLSLVTRAVVPFDHCMVSSDSNIGILHLSVISSLGVYGIIIAHEVLICFWFWQHLLSVFGSGLAIVFSINFFWLLSFVHKESYIYPTRPGTGVGVALSINLSF